MPQLLCRCTLEPVLCNRRNHKKKKKTSKCSRHWGYQNEQTAPCSGGACILLKSEGADKDNHTCKVVSESVKSLEKNSDVMESA